MTLSQLQMILETIKETVSKLQITGCSLNTIITVATGNVIYIFFWDYKTDKPTCDWDIMYRAVKNTIFHMKGIDNHV